MVVGGRVVLDDDAATIGNAVDRHLDGREGEHISRGIHVVDELEDGKARHGRIDKSVLRQKHGSSVTLRPHGRHSLEP